MWGCPSFPLACQELILKGLEKATTLPISAEPYEQMCVHFTARQTLGFSFSLWALGLSPKATPLPSVASELRARLSDLEEVTLSPSQAVRLG